MNILFAADVSISKVLGGAERVLLEQTTRLSERGHEVHIITRRLPFHSSSYEKIRNVHEWRYDVNKKNSVTFLVSTVLNCQKLFKQISQKISIDLVNFHQPFSAFAINLLRDTKKIKKIYTCHSLSFEEYKTRILRRSFLKTPIFCMNIFWRKFIEKFSLSKCARLMVLSQFTKDKLINIHSIPSEKIAINPGGVDLELFRPSLNKMKIRKKLDIPEDKFVLLTVRNLVSRMGLENLIKAMALIKDRINNIYLVIGGEGILRKKLQELIKEHNLENSVKLHGFVSEERLPLYYQTADLFILPTIALEGFGLINVEAMACGTPVLGTPVGGTKEILSKFNPAFLFKDTSPESISDLILEKYNYYKEKPEEYEKISKQCRIFAEKNYSWERNIDEIQTVFAQLKKEK
ncbi:MAG: glycosyltransferase [Candidatus Aminicenantes bacterium]|nr:glycosyltransferase [Candidatus Aminicenantes bacterium]